MPFLPVSLQRFFRYAAMMIVAVLTCLLAGCGSRDESDSLHGLQLSLSLPPDDIMPLDGAVGRSDIGFVRRCVIDVFKSGTAERIMRHEFIPVIDSVGRFESVVDLPAGEYDFRIWSDYVRGASPRTDLCYNTGDLDWITLTDPRPEIEAGYRDAAFGYLENVGCPSVSGKVGLQLTRAVGRYTVLGENVREYLLLHEDLPDHFPPVEDLRFEVISSLFTPDSFCVTDGDVKNAVTGLSYICNPSILPGCGITPDDELTMADDMILMGDKDVELTLTINVRSAEGAYVGYISGLPVKVRRDRLTVIRGSFLELGALSGHILIDRNWADDIIINF